MLKSAEAKDITEDVPIEEKSDISLTRDIYFSLKQANVAKDLLQAVNQTRDVHIEAQSKWEAFLVGIGMCSGDEIIGGDLDSDDPNKRRLTVKASNGIAGE